MKKIVTALLLLAVVFTTFTVRADQTEFSPQTWIVTDGGYYDPAKKDFVIPPNSFDIVSNFAPQRLGSS